MQNEGLFDYILEYKNGDEKAFGKILQKMNPLIQKYVCKLNDKDSMSDFSFCIFNIVNGINLNNFNQDFIEYQLLLYFKKTIHRKYIELSKQKDINESSYTYDDSLLIADNGLNPVFLLELRQAIDELIDKQRFVIELVYFQGYSETEISKRMNISRQAVNRLKNAALQHLYKNLK